MQTSLSTRHRSRALNRGIHTASLVASVDGSFYTLSRTQIRPAKRHKCRAPGFAAALLLLAFLVAGCNKGGTTILGQPPAGEPQTIMGARASHGSNAVVLQGVLIEKCPVAGCWFRLRDQSGVIKVDTKSAGFVVTSVPLETRVTVAGKLTALDGEAAFEATGLRY